MSGLRQRGVSGWQRPLRRRRLGGGTRVGIALATAGLLTAAVTTPATATAALPHAATPPAGNAVAPPAAALPAPLVETTVSVGGQDDAAVPAPPADAMGSPAASTLVQADELKLTGIQRPAVGAQTVNEYWASAGYENQSSLSVPGSATLRKLLNPNYPTAAGRFRDVTSDRTMAFQMTSDGSNSILQLSSNDSTTQPSWGGPAPGCPIAPGDTCSIQASLHRLSEADAATGMGFSGFDIGNPTPTTNQLWTVADAGDADGYVQLVSQSDGLCLTALGDTVGAAVATRPCVDTGLRPPEQLWKARYQNQWFTLLAKGSGLPLADSNPAASFAPAELGGGAGITGALSVAFGINEPRGAIPTWSTEVPGTNPAVPTAMATGDLDRVVGRDDNYHDEAVVAYADPTTHQLEVRVIDYNANTSHLLASAPDQALPVVGAVENGIWFPGSVGVAVGDFGLVGDDALNEIAVTWQDGTGRFHLTMLKYRGTPTGGRALTVIGGPAGTTLFTDQPATESLTSGYAQTVAGDFAGDGDADVAIAYAAANPGTTQLSGHLGVVSLTSDFRLRGQTAVQYSDSELTDSARDGGTWTPHGLRLAVGYFRDDPQNGYNFQRRELAVVWTQEGTGHGNRGLAVYDVNGRPNCGSDTCALSLDPQIAPFFSNETLRGDEPIPMAAGGFEGVGTGASAPLWDIVIWSADSERSVLRVLQPQADGTAFLPAHATTFTTITDSTQVVLTSYDRAGASLALGAPLIYTTTNMTKATLIAAQPPTHADWLDGQFVNVSRVGEFAVTMGSSQTQSYSHTYTTTASHTDGVTQSADIKASLRNGTKDTNITGSVEIRQKFDMNWSETSSQFDKYSTTVTTTATATGQDDDIVQADLQTMTFYRYPILGRQGTAPDGTVLYPFYQVTVPGQVIPVNGFGRSLSFYQPSWQNGDALSYPALAGGTVAIPDLGAYSYTDQSGNTIQVKAPLLDTVNDVGGGATTDEMKITGATGSGNTTKTEQKMRASVQVKGTFSVSVDIGIEKAAASVSLSLGYNAARATGTNDVGTSSTSQASSFAMEVPTIDSNKSYRIGTAYYMDDAGVPKVIHGVDLTSDVNSQGFWTSNYGRAPDPALNLPDASFLAKDEFGKLVVPKFSTLATRQLIRGFAALQPYDPNSPMTSGQPYATDPRSGDQVNFAVQVHNFSLAPLTKSIPVEFYAVPVDALGLDITGPPEPIGTVDSGTIPARGVVTLNSPTWTAAANGANAQNWRIFVVLDPDNDGHEIHPWQGTICPRDALDPKAPAGTITADGTMIDPMTGQSETLACGQNNQGYGTITVMPATKGGSLGGPPPRVQVDGVGFPGGTSGAARMAKQAVPSVPLDQSVTGVVHAATTANSAAIQPVLVYDGPPSQGRLITATTMAGATKIGGGAAQFTWRPSTPGRHTLYVELVGGDPTSNSEQTVQVDVVAPVTAATAVLDWKNERTGSDRGYGFAAVRVDGQRVCFGLRWTALNTPTGADLEPVSAVGTVAVPLFMTTPGPHATAHTAWGCVTTNAATATDLAKHPERYFVNVRTAEFPAGAIGGTLRGS